MRATSTLSQAVGRCHLLPLEDGSPHFLVGCQLGWQRKNGTEPFQHPLCVTCLQLLSMNTTELCMWGVVSSDPLHSTFTYISSLDISQSVPNDCKLMMFATGFNPITVPRNTERLIVCVMEKQGNRRVSIFASQVFLTHGGVINSHKLSWSWTAFSK